MRIAIKPRSTKRLVEDMAVLSPGARIREAANQSITRWHGVGGPVPCTSVGQTWGWW